MSGWLDYPESPERPHFDSGLSASYCTKHEVGWADVYGTHEVKGYEWIHKSRSSEDFRDRQEDRRTSH